MDFKETVLKGAFESWLRKKGLNVLDSGDEAVIRFEEDGREHAIMFSNMEGNTGALAATSPKAAERITLFMDEVLGDQVGHVMHSIPASGREEAEQMLKGLMADGPEAAKDFVEKEASRHPLINKMKILHRIANKAAKESGDPEKIAEVERLSKILETIDSIEELVGRGKKDPEKTTNENEYERLDNLGKVRKISKVKRLYVGQKFFDEHKNLCIAVGFERGKKVTGEFVNSVIMIPNTESDEYFAGMPIKRNLEELIRVVDI